MNSINLTSAVSSVVDHNLGSGGLELNPVLETHTDTRNDLNKLVTV